MEGVPTQTMARATLTKRYIYIYIKTVKSKDYRKVDQNDVYCFRSKDNN